MDGTVLSHTTGSILPSALHAISSLRRKGVLVYGCTGRHTEELRRLPLENLQVDGWITLNGALSYTMDGTILSEYPISEKDIHTLYDCLCVTPFPVQFMEKDRAFMNMHADYVEEGLKHIHSTQDPLCDLREILQHKIYMFIPWAEDSLLQPVLRKLESCRCVRWNDYAVDCFNEKCGKKQGIEDVLQHYHIPSSEAACVGDGENDLSMFEACGIRVAMGNACESLKQKAQYVTADIDQDGLAKAIAYIDEK